MIWRFCSEAGGIEHQLERLGHEVNYSIASEHREALCRLVGVRVDRL
jgi:hypothetical protein